MLHISLHCMVYIIITVGVCVVMIDVPHNITAINYIHWTWHDTDPNIFERFYWVPWNAFYFQATFSAGFTFWFHCWRRIIMGSSADKWEAGWWVLSSLYNLIIISFLILYLLLAIQPQKGDALLGLDGSFRNAHRGFSVYSNLSPIARYLENFNPLNRLLKSLLL